eukprot:scaffold509676_cov45-Prasinocladus_malaysianus.AAC.1
MDVPLLEKYDYSIVEKAWAELNVRSDFEMMAKVDCFCISIRWRYGRTSSGGGPGSTGTSPPCWVAGGSFPG